MKSLAQSKWLNKSYVFVLPVRELECFMQHYEVTFLLHVSRLAFSLWNGTVVMPSRIKTSGKYIKTGHLCVNTAGNLGIFWPRVHCFETIKTHLRSVFLPEQLKQPCLVVSVKGVSDNNTSYLLQGFNDPAAQVRATFFRYANVAKMRWMHLCTLQLQ